MFAKAIIADSGSKVGDIFGPSKTVMAVDIKQKPYRMIVSGENYEVYVFDGVPFKSVKSIHSHQNFVNQVKFSPNGQQFLSVSSDKSIIIYDTESLEQVRKIEKAHNKGILDANWIDDQRIITCSSDNTVKIWNTVEGTELR